MSRYEREREGNTAGHTDRSEYRVVRGGWERGTQGGEREIERESESREVERTTCI